MDDVALLGLLLTDPAERELLSRCPEEFRLRHDLDDPSLGFAQGIDGEQLEAQAECLLRKRLHEVRFFVPETVAGLGEDLWQRFQDYAAGFWPTGHKRHAVDALHFLRYLKEHGDVVNPREFNRIQFALSGHPAALKVILSRHPLRIGFHLLWRQHHGYRDWIWSVGRNKKRPAAEHSQKSDPE